MNAFEGFVGNSNGTYTRIADAAGPFMFDGEGMVYASRPIITCKSTGNLVNTTGIITIPAVTNKTAYLQGFDVTGSGATVANRILMTITGLLGGTLTYIVTVDGVISGVIVPIFMDYQWALPASGVNTPIILTLPAFGLGNTNASLVARYFYV